MRKAFINSAISILCCTTVLSSAVAETTYTCSSVPYGVTMEGNGNVYIENLGGLKWAELCNVETAANGIAPAACKSLYATLLLAQSTGRVMTLWFNNGPIGCAANVPWTFAKGLYFWKIDA